MEVFVIVVSIPGITIIIILFWLFNLVFKLACMLWKGMFKTATHSHQGQLLTHSTSTTIPEVYAPMEVLTADYIIISS